LQGASRGARGGRSARQARRRRCDARARFARGLCRRDRRRRKEMGADRQKPQLEIRVARMLRWNVLLVPLAALWFGLASPAAADDYPTKPITLIVPFPAGGGVDVIGRIVADKLAAELGQPVVIDNRGGAAGVIGTRVAARAAPDGYTLVMATSGSIAINPNLYANPGYQ